VCTINDFVDEAPVHGVYLDDFYIYVTEVTNAQYAEFLTQVGNREEGGAPWYGIEDGFGDLSSLKGTWSADPEYYDDPVVEVTWYGAAAYCDWAGGRLPTEAEWEKAAKGDTDNVFPWGDQFYSDVANVDDETEFSEDKIICSDSGCDGYVDTAPVGSFLGGASPYSVLDMAGNVWEWVYDWYDDDYYSYSPYENPAGPADGELKIRRGGSWWSYDLNVRVANRGPVKPTAADITLGFRCVFEQAP
jgi:formylglycine-generating enzyme required for sulfatase activity